MKWVLIALVIYLLSLPTAQDLYRDPAGHYREFRFDGFFWPILLPIQIVWAAVIMVMLLFGRYGPKR